MRYFATFLIPVLAATTLAGCGSDDPTEPPTHTHARRGH